ncbi:hypothetical protein ACO2Q3_23200 [Caulobacter sp. KR2-114]|uniref:hypothetical protein n=1 Tax=Caulobacter sp. KR2-114 TaxID=3400912 RepID=UPI003C121BDE
MSTDEAGPDPGANLRNILTGTRPRPWIHPALFAVPVLLLAGVGGWAWWSATRPEAPAYAAAPVETSICEDLLRETSKAFPDRFYVCASRPKTIWRIEGPQRFAMPLLANAVYELPLDGTTKVENLASPDMRYGAGGGYCTGLLPQDQGRVFTLEKNQAPVDANTC